LYMYRKLENLPLQSNTYVCLKTFRYIYTMLGIGCQAAAAVFWHEVLYLGIGILYPCMKFEIWNPGINFGTQVHTHEMPRAEISNLEHIYNTWV
jgi:hypothetical protein